MTVLKDKGVTLTIIISENTKAISVVSNKNDKRYTECKHYNTKSDVKF